MENKKLENLTVSEIKAKLAAGEITLEELDTEKLNLLMDYETDLICFGEGDVELISKCADIICEREPLCLSHEQFMEIVDKSIKKYSQPAKKRFSIKRVFIIAAAVVILAVGGTAVASAFGFNMYDLIAKVILQPNGTEFEKDGFTFYNAGKYKTYQTLKEAVEKENLNVMYPASLPEGVTIKKVTVANSDRGDKCINIFTHNNNVMLSFDIGVIRDDEVFEGEELYTAKNGVSYVFYECPEDFGYKYGAYTNVNNCEYTVQTQKYQDLIYIIENMEDNNEKNN